MDSYSKFLAHKQKAHMPCGIDAKRVDVRHLFDFQAQLTKWAARKGRCAIFADTGLGKTRIQAAWADAIAKATGKAVIILAPLAVAAQTANEAAKMGIQIQHCRDQSEIDSQIVITNYDRLHRFDAAMFGAVVLDESSIIKHHDAKTLGVLIDRFSSTPYRLACTATPAPNDWTELGTHAEFLGICSRSEMLSEFFTHDGGNTQSWRLKRHARSDFWKWVSSWGAMIRSPEDLGFDGSRYNLPSLHIEQISVDSDAKPKDGEMFALEAQTLSDRRQARRYSLSHRVSACADLANSIDEPWVIWCELNAEGDALKAAIPDAKEIRGSDTPEHKEKLLEEFANGSLRVLITKPKIAGFGLNWQHCRRVGFIGVTDSWEAYYQAIRRCWRFGQQKEVFAYLFVSDQEGAVRANLERKEKDAKAMADELSMLTLDAMRDEVIGQARYTNIYSDDTKIRIPNFLLSPKEHAA